MSPNCSSGCGKGWNTKGHQRRTFPRSTIRFAPAGGFSVVRAEQPRRKSALGWPLNPARLILVLRETLLQTGTRAGRPWRNFSVNTAKMALKLKTEIASLRVLVKRRAGSNCVEIIQKLELILKALAHCCNRWSLHIVTASNSFLA